MSERIQGKRVAFLVANEGVEQVELTAPVGGGRAGRRRAGADRPGVRRGAGVQPSRQGRHLRRRPHGRRGRCRRLRRAGAAGRGRQPRHAAHGARRRSSSPAPSSRPGKPVAAICHAPWTLVEAGVVDGRTLTSWPSLQTDIRNAGGEWVDEEVHVDCGPGHQPQARRPRGVLREDDRGDRRGRARRAARGDGRVLTWAGPAALRRRSRSRAPPSPRRGCRTG